MKIQVIGRTENRLQFVKWVKDVTGYGLKESKELVDLMFETKKPLTLNVVNYNEAFNSFNQCLSGSGLTIKKDRVEIINKLLREGSLHEEVKSDFEYENFLELFDYLYKTDKENLRDLMNKGVDNLKEKLNDFKL